MRVTGLASGMDIDSMVKQLMSAERIPLNKLKQKQQILEWKRDDYRGINTSLLSFQKELSSMKLTANYRTRLVASSDENKLSVKANNGASLSSYSISNVTQLAQSEVKQNTGSIFGTSRINVNDKLYALDNSYGNASSSTNAWKEGAVVSKNVVTDFASQTVFLDATNLDANKLEDWSVKVDGKSYKVVTNMADFKDPSADPSDPDYGPVPTVFVDANGTMTFSNELKEGSKVSVTYIATEKTDKSSVRKDSNSIQIGQVGIVGNVSIKLTTDDNTDPPETTTYTVQAGDDTVYDQSMSAVGVIDRDTGKITFDDNIEKKMKAEVTYSHKYTNYSIDSKTSSGAQHENFIFTGKDTFAGMMNTVNSSKVGVTMFYDSNTGSMTMTRKESGNFDDKGNLISNNAAAGDQMTTNGIFIDQTLKFAGASKTSVAKNAEFSINGLQTERASNTFEMSGVTFTIKQKFTDAVSANVTNDPSTTFDKIKSFVDKYNELIKSVQDKTGEEKNKKYEPLTDEQREVMSESQIEKWENLAKSGLLRHDSILTNALSRMRIDFSSSVNNGQISEAYNQLSEIGITSTRDYLQGGKLEINEEKLKKAISEDPDSVEQMFRGEGGIISRLSETVSNTITTVKNKAGNSYSTNQTFAIGKDLEELKKSIYNFEKRLIDVEDRYYRKFSAMESAIQKANSQSDYLANMFK